MVEQLSDKKWGEFFLEDIGEIKSGKDITKVNMIKGDTPYVSSSAQNNGVSAYVGNTNNTLESDCISINRNGSVGYAFYHPYNALFSNDCRKFKIGKNKYISLFISNQIKAQKEKYNYGYKMGTGRIKRQKIMLPITEEGEPDYVFMTEYMKNMEIELINKYKLHIKKTKDNNINKSNEKNKINWESFILSDIFDINSTNSGIDKNKIKDKHIEGDNPYITRSDKNNGIDDFIIEQDYDLNEGNVITIGLDTQTVFYQPHSFYTGQNIQVLSNNHLNKYNGLYLVNLLKIVLDKFNWGSNGATLTRLNNSRILLPVNNEGIPDYEYMEEYVRSIEFELINKYLDYLEKKS